jgi:hypothetical protein
MPSMPHALLMRRRHEQRAAVSTLKEGYVSTSTIW